MNLKEVFKPDKNKIGLSLLLLGIVIIIGIILGYLKGMYTDLGCHSWSCYSTAYKIMTIATTILSAVFILPVFLFTLLAPSDDINVWVWLIFLILELCYLYVLACIIRHIKKSDGTTSIGASADIVAGSGNVDSGNSPNIIRPNK